MCRNLKGAFLTDTLSMVRQCGGTSLHSSVASQEQCTAQSLHFLHLQKATGRDWRGGTNMHVIIIYYIIL